MVRNIRHRRSSSAVPAREAACVVLELIVGLLTWDGTGELSVVDGRRLVVPRQGPGLQPVAEVDEEADRLPAVARPVVERQGGVEDRPDLDALVTRRIRDDERFAAQPREAEQRRL